jgi:hypothetical protein
VYFPAFDQEIQSSLSDRTTYIVEHLVSQLLFASETTFLKAVIKGGQLAQALYDEIEFTGQVPKRELPGVHEYLIKQEKCIKKTAKTILKTELALNDLRSQVLQPLTIPEL